MGQICVSDSGKSVRQCEIFLSETNVLVIKIIRVDPTIFFFNQSVRKCFVRGELIVINMCQIWRVGRPEQFFWLLAQDCCRFAIVGDSITGIQIIPPYTNIRSLKYYPVIMLAITAKVSHYLCMCWLVSKANLTSDIDNTSPSRLYIIRQIRTI